MKTIDCIILTTLIFFLFSCNSKQNKTEQEYELVEVEEEIEVECPECKGAQYVTYTCYSCNGTGKKQQFHSGTHSKQCTSCYGTGKMRCEKCGGNGYIDCPYCNNGKVKCGICGGNGSLFLRGDYMTCPRCDGTGIDECAVCNSYGRMNCSCDDGLATCEDCWGSGRGGQESYSYTESVNCNNCNGTGHSRVICQKCKGKGVITETRIVHERKSKL